MTKFNEKSILKSKDIIKVLTNKQDYKYQDFSFKVIIPSNQWLASQGFYVEVYNFDVMILKLEVDYITRLIKKDKIIQISGGKSIKAKDYERETLPNNFDFKVIEFNPQTNNDTQSINHIIAVYSDLIPSNLKHKDRGNCSVLNNQYIFRRKDNYYTFTKVWQKGKVKPDNFDVDLSHEFGTEEYIQFIKYLHGFRIIQRRSLKKDIKQAIDKACSREIKKKVFNNL